MEVEDKYAAFRHKTNGHIYVYIEVPVELLQSPVPEDATGAKKNVEYDEEGNEVSFEVYTIAEYLTVPPTISKDGTRAVCLLNERQAPRMKGVSSQDMDFWDEHLKPLELGLDSGKWMTIEQKTALLESEDYKTEED